jgi:hypothetical protein
MLIHLSQTTLLVFKMVRPCNSPQSCCGDTAKMKGWEKDESRKAATARGKYAITSCFR